MNVPNEIRLETPATTETVQATIQKMVEENELLVFMKGNALMPQCGFSAQVVEILKRMGASFKTFDILKDEEVRQGIKEFSSRPTLPQVYYKQKFVGGCDIVTEMYQNGELDRLIAAKA